MAHSRIIRQTFYNDPKVASKYKLDERYLLIGLACVADDFGKFWWSPVNIRSVTFPTDPDVKADWIEQVLKKFVKDHILCMYEVDDIMHGHFPKWFESGWFLKQKIDHPREFQHPDCPICLTETKKRESSRAIKYNKKKANIKESNKNEVNVIEILIDPDFHNRMKKKYSLITKDHYERLTLNYDDWVKQNGEYDRDHCRLFEKILSEEYEKEMNSMMT